MAGILAVCPADTSQENLAAPQVVRSSLAGPGVPGKVVITPGEDWWLPDSVEWSDHGAVIAGYGEPWAKENNWVCRGQAYWMGWKGLEPKPGILDTRFLNSLLTRYGNSNPPNGKKPKFLHINIHGTDCGSYAPEYLSKPPYSVPLLEDLLGRCPRPVPDRVRKLWLERWNSHLKWAYPFWHPVFIKRRKAFHAQLAQYLKQHPQGNTLWSFPVMGEFGTLWMYVKYGLVTLEEVDRAAEPYVLSAIESGLPPKKWLINLAVGGRAYKVFADLALKYRTGIGNHGARGLMPYQFAQHLAHIRYDEKLRAYRQTMAELPYAFFHTDCEYLLHTPNTLGQYRVFRLGCLSAVAMGVNRLLITASDIPSMGHDRPWKKKRKGWFDWPKVRDMGGLQFVEWLNRTLGRPAVDAPEAFCVLAQTGTPAPPGASFSETVKDLKRNVNWNPFPPWVRTPLLTHFGRYCHLDLSVQGGAGLPVLKMDEPRLGKTHPSFTSWECGEGMYEARSTNRAAGNPCLYFRIDDTLAESRGPGAGLIVKVVFSNYLNRSGSWTLDYCGPDGWTSAGTVNLRIGKGEEEKLYTATFNLPRARLKRAGPGKTDLAIRSLNGADAAFLLVRVLLSE